MPLPYSTLTPTRALMLHRRLTLPSVALVALLSFPAPGMTETAGEAGFVFTADERGNSVSRFDLATGTVTIVAIAVAPHNVQIGDDFSSLVRPLLLFMAKAMAMQAAPLDC